MEILDLISITNICRAMLADANSDKNKKNNHLYNNIFQLACFIIKQRAYV